MAVNWRAYLPIMERRYNLPAGLLGALIRQESGGNPTANSGAGAYGLTQLMPGTAAELGVDRFNVLENLEGGARYLSQQLRRFGRVDYALAAYNAGPGRVEQYGGLPPYSETQNYVKRVMGYWRESGGHQRQEANTTGLGQQQGQRPSSVYTVDPATIAKTQHAWSDAPENGALRIGAMYDKQAKSHAAAARQGAVSPYGQSTSGTGAGGMGMPNARSGWYRTPEGWIQAQRDGEADWQFLQRLGTRGFGLQNDPGNSQTTGGGHTSGSQHYSGNAIDFGDARNSWDQLNTWFNWLQARRGVLGISELLNEGDHIHVGLR